MQTRSCLLTSARLLLPVIFAFAAASAFAGAPNAVEVKAIRPARGDIIRYVTLPGSIRAHQQATLYAKVPGYLKSIAVDKGDQVKAGEALGEIEVPELLADLAKYKAELHVAEIEAKRLKAAREKAPDLVTPLAVDEAAGKLEVAKANMERIDTLLRYSRLTAPFSGVITMRHVDPGAFIPAATGGNAAAAAVLTLMDFATVRVQVAVPESDAALIREGQPVTVNVEGLPGRSVEGKVSRHSYALDDASRTMLVESDLPNPDLTLRPGMYAIVKIGIEKHTGALLIPVESLVMEKANTFAFVVNGDKASKRAIKVGFNNGTKAEVLSGVTGADLVILAGKTVLADNQPVNVTEAK